MPPEDREGAWDTVRFYDISLEFYPEGVMHHKNSPAFTREDKTLATPKPGTREHVSAGHKQGEQLSRCR